MDIFSKQDASKPQTPAFPNLPGSELAGSRRKHGEIEMSRCDAGENPFLKKQRGASSVEQCILSEQSAVYKVFAITELREAILIACGLQYLEEALDEDNRRSPQPIPGLALTLFPLQRVCRAFAVTMRQSPSLRCLMGKDCIDPNEFDSPLPWFLAQLGAHLDLDVEVRSESGVYVQLSVWNNFYFLDRCKVPDCWKHKSATWRSLRIFNREEPNYGIAQIDLVHLIFFLDCEYCSDVSQLELKITPETEPTLGDVYQQIQDMISEFTPCHVPAVYQKSKE